MFLQVRCYVLYSSKMLSVHRQKSFFPRVLDTRESDCIRHIALQFAGEGQFSVVTVSRQHDLEYRRIEWLNPAVDLSTVLDKELLLLLQPGKNVLQLSGLPEGA